MIKVAILTVSNKYAGGDKEDKCKTIIEEKLDKSIYEVVAYEVIEQDVSQTKKKLIQYCDDLKADLILTAGGTGLTAKDNVPEVTQGIIAKNVPGIAEAMRIEGLKKTKKAMLSRGISGIRGKTLIINLPGSSRGVEESLDAIIEELPRAIRMLLREE